MTSSNDNEPNLVDDIRAFVRPQVARGTRTFADILDEAIEVLLEEHVDADQGTVERLAHAEIEAAFAEHLSAQANWPKITDCDRLDRAFDVLNEGGIVARHDFTCCQNCGFAEIGEEIADAIKAGVDVTGFTFYHAQDTDNATEGGGLYLSYGHVEGGDVNAIAVGRIIVSALNAAGLQTEWDGTVGKRIAVRLDWKRRIQPSAAVNPSKA